MFGWVLNTPLLFEGSSNESSNVLFLYVLHYKTLEICYFFKVLLSILPFDLSNIIPLTRTKTLVSNLLMSKFKWKSILEHKGYSSSKHKNDKTANPAKYYVQKVLRTKIWYTQNCRRKFIKNFPEKQRKQVNLTTAFKFKSGLSETCLIDRKSSLFINILSQ